LKRDRHRGRCVCFIIFVNQD